MDDYFVVEEDFEDFYQNVTMVPGSETVRVYLSTTLDDRLEQYREKYDIQLVLENQTLKNVVTLSNARKTVLIQDDDGL